MFKVVRKQRKHRFLLVLVLGRTSINSVFQMVVFIWWFIIFPFGVSSQLLELAAE